MSEEILINVTSKEVRVALLNKGKLQEIYIEREAGQGIVGNIYKGKVTRLVPGMQAAFVDIGLNRSAFLHVSDLLEYAKQADTSQADIHQFLRAGQEILVQVYKDALGAKGPRLTTQFSIPSRYLVLTPGVPNIFVSQKITQPAERERLQALLTAEGSNGYIFRTQAVGVDAEEILPDQAFLAALWEEITLNAKQAKPGQVVYSELSLPFRILRDVVSGAVSKIQVDNKAMVEKIHAFANRYMPKLANKIEFYDVAFPLFTQYGIDEEIEKSLQRKVYLPSGGHLVIDQTEAMTTIDVNTGSYLGNANIGQMVLTTNLEAATAIARQVRLRNLGGIIIIDFIDMNDLRQREQLLRSLAKAVASDLARVDISELSSLGLIQMTRKRTRESLEHILCDPCPTCQRRGSIKSIQTICYHIFREIKRLNVVYAWPKLVVSASQEVIAFLQTEESKSLAELARELNKPIGLQVELSYGREQYRVLPGEM